MKHIKWPERLTNFTGRNGHFKCSGVEALFLPHDDSVMVTPFTSRDELGKCDITVPVTAIPQLVAALSEIHTNWQNRTGIRQR